MDLEKHLIELSNTPGLSGYEAPIRAAIQKAWKGLADDYHVDDLGSLVATRRGTGKSPRRRALITGHMDEIGLMVTYIDGAFLRVTNVGGVDRRIILSQPVVVHADKPIRGLIGSRPPHVLKEDERKKFPAFQDVVVDTGLSERELRRRVRVGTVVSFDQKAISMGNGTVVGKAMDNRASVAALTQILHNLQGRQHDWDILAAATVQEEVTLGGGHTVAWRTQPDLAIVIDTGWAIGVGVGDDKGFPLDGGPTICIGPNAHPKLFDLMRAKAKELEISLAVEAYPGSTGTEAWATQVSRDGVPSAIISIPIRNMHSPTEIVAVKDIERAARLITEFVIGLDGETMGGLALD